VQLSYGLSSEHATDLKTDTDAVDDDRKVFAKYYVTQLLSKKPEDISAAWVSPRATSLKLPSPVAAVGLPPSGRATTTPPRTTPSPPAAPRHVDEEPGRE